MKTCWHKHAWDIVILGELIIVAIFFLSLLLAGCTMMLSEHSAGEVRQVVTHESVPATYQRAYRAAQKMGGRILREEPEHYVFVAAVKEVVALHVSVDRIDTGTQMTVRGSILPKHVAFGLLTEVDDFVQAYRAN